MSGATWITPLAEGRSGLRVAVKDLIDVAGVPTTAGCRAVADAALPAAHDAACLGGLRAAVEAGRARLVGKANLHELADGITGVNPWFGTPVNPLDPALVPGGSSSGSAVAVAAGEADVAFGTDTGGSVRIPAACCGVVGLKTTRGRVPLAGVWPLAASLDTVGPIATTVAGAVEGMALLEPGFSAVPLDGPVGRLRLPLPCNPVIDAAVDSALAAAGVEVVDIKLPGWREAAHAGLDILGFEAVAAHGALVAAHPGEIGSDVVANFAHGARVGHQRLRDARSLQSRWQGSLEAALGRVAALALPTMGSWAPPVGPDAGAAMTILWTLPINLAGLPALSLPVPAGTRLPASIQLVGPAGGEEGLCALGSRLEAAAAR